MVEISPEMLSLLLDIAKMVISAVLGSYLTYVYAIKKILQERVLTERVALYRPLIHNLSSLIDMAGDSKKVKDLEIELNRLNRELLLFAPDNVYTAFLEAVSTVKKGRKAVGITEFMIALRKELVGKTQLTAEDVVDIELRP